MGYFLSIKSLFFERIIGELLEHKRRFLISVATWVFHIAEYRTGLSFPPSGIIGIPCGFQTTTVGMLFFRLSHDVLANFSAVLQHEIVLTCTYVTLVTLSFSFGIQHTGSLSTSTHTHRTGFPANFLQPYGTFVPVFCIPYGLQKP